MGVLALVDTEASLSLLRGDLVRDVMRRQGRPFAVRKCAIELKTLSSDRLCTEGRLEGDVPRVVLVQFIVVKTMAHEAILSWHQMSRHEWSLGATRVVMK